ncbi:MAG TPA: MoaD/ThiS family protein [Myxococcota bacterium]|nr:MoaD/ThiS family protein [Myxococcota bacterium]HRY95676.1 MoaD/ThiS family protein [Myxococcota bacterium]HSA24157.1 MoaD/ThiS family protein [Myxococcota bacterium]
MDIQVTFLGPIRRPWPETSRRLSVEPGTTAEALLVGLGYEPQDLQRVALVINGKRQKPQVELAEGDQLRVVLLAGGG